MEESIWQRRHAVLENNAVLLSVLAGVLVFIGGLVEIVPLIAIKANVPTIDSVKPYSPLELEGRDIYIREGCYNCHTQMVRPFRAETLRYGPYSRAGEYVYEHPFQWGSKRTGPDLWRVGGKYPDAWHYRHLEDPQETSPNSVMPPYPWLMSDTLDASHIQGKMEIMQTLGVPYTDGDLAAADQAIADQAAGIVKRLGDAKITVEPDKEIVALIAYLQRLGTDGRKAFAK